MLQIDFHVHVADTLVHGYRLLRKIYRSQQRVVVCCDNPSWLAHLDEALWCLAPTDFLPHVLATDPLAANTPIILNPSVEVPQGHFDVVVNAATDLPTGFERCRRIIDIVGHDAAQRDAGRARWRRYRALGYCPTSHDLQPETRSSHSSGS
jgi:DNA polymerase-3 subunit chi